MTDKRTPYGVIHYGGRCRDDYPNIVIDADGSRVVKLQRPAMRSFHAAQDRYGKDRPSGTREIPLTGSWRSCALQTQLHDSDPSRYADPDTSFHPRGLAVDVSTANTPANLLAIHRALIAEGWFQARPDEPWHYSFGVPA